MKSTEIREFGAFSGTTRLHAANVDGRVWASSSSSAMTVVQKVPAESNDRNPWYPSEAAAYGPVPNRTTSAKDASLRLRSCRLTYAQLIADHGLSAGPRGSVYDRPVFDIKCKRVGK